MKENIPEFLYKILLNEYEEIDLKRIIDGFCSNRPVTFRVNTSKTSIEYVKDLLDSLNIKYRQVEWNKFALILDNVKESNIKELEIYKNGEIYLQSLSSMIPPLILDPKDGENILDMTAAPGGKTTQIADLSNNKAMITACEKNKIRAERLKYNLKKQGASRVTVMIRDARKLDNFFSFDKILLDAPCSRKWNIKFKHQRYRKSIYKRTTR